LIIECTLCILDDLEVHYFGAGYMMFVFGDRNRILKCHSKPRRLWQLQERALDKVRPGRVKNLTLH